jgi:predicted nucleotide-binding protein
MKWSKAQVVEVLQKNGLSAEERELQGGVKFVLPEGTHLNLYESTGKLLVQGKKNGERAQCDSLFGTPPPKPGTVVSPIVTISEAPAAPVRTDPKVFVVYGHDTAARDALELILLRFNIKPIILGNLAPDGKTIIEALLAQADVPYAVVLLTPDDEGHKAGCPEGKRFRARQNVVLEPGMFLMKLGRDRVAILHKGDLELPSGINGLIYIPFQNHVREAKAKLAAALQNAGFQISVAALSAE